MLESQSDFARRCNVSRQRVAQWIKDKRVSGGALVSEGGSVKIDVDKAQVQLKNRLDPGQRLGNGLETKLARAAPPSSSASDDVAPDLVCALAMKDPADIKAVALGLLLTRDIGAWMANLALAAGASVKVAFAMKELVTHAFIGEFEDALVDLNVPTDSITYMPDCISDLDWPARAAAAGQTFDLAVCEAWANERKTFMAKTPERD